MNNESSFQPTVSRLAELISRQFGCSFEFQARTDLEREELEWNSLQHGLLSGQPISFGDWIFLPVFNGDTLAGAGRIERREKITENDLLYIHQMIRLVLESRLEGLDRIDWLDRCESMSRADREEAAQSNVIALNQFHRNKFPLPAKGRLDLLNFPFLIEAESESEAFKMAQEIHSMSQRYAFLPLQDLNAEALNSTESIEALGAITIYISDITQISRSQQVRIAAFYASERTGDSPQFIVVSSLSVGELKQNPTILPQFLSAVTTSYLAMNKPFAHYKKNNLMDFFYSGI